MNALNTSTPARPDTEMMHSITVQVLRFCTTLTPRYSFTNQNPASLTCERKSEPAPIAKTISETCADERSAATGARMPDAVTVATVAEPVATRINTATSQARTSTGRL